MFKQSLWRPPLNSTGYVCQRCRHRFAAAQAQAKAAENKRHESTSTTPVTSGGDGWADNFNDLSSSLPSEPAKRRSRDDKADGKAEARPVAFRKQLQPTVQSTKSIDRQLERRRDAADDGLSRAEVSGTLIPLKHKDSRPTLRELRAGLKEVLARDNKLLQDANSKMSVATGHSAVEASKADGNALESTSATSSRWSVHKSNQRQRRRNRKERALAAHMIKASQGNDMVANRPSEASNETPGNVGEREQFESVMASLGAGSEEGQQASNPPPATMQAQTSSTDPMEQLKAQLKAKTEALQPSTGSRKPTVEDDIDVSAPPRRMEKPDFPFPATDDVTVPAGIVSGQRASHVDSEPSALSVRRYATKEVYRAVESDGKTSQSEIASSYIFPQRKSTSPAALVEEKKNAPGWGLGSTRSPTQTADYDLLRKSDEVSANVVPSTAGETKAWGVDRVTKTKGASGVDGGRMSSNQTMLGRMMGAGRRLLGIGDLKAKLEQELSRSPKSSAGDGKADSQTAATGEGIGLELLAAADKAVDHIERNTLPAGATLADIDTEVKVASTTTLPNESDPAENAEEDLAPQNNAAERLGNLYSMRPIEPAQVESSPVEQDKYIRAVAGRHAVRRIGKLEPKVAQKKESKSRLAAVKAKQPSKRSSAAEATGAMADQPNGSASNVEGSSSGSSLPAAPVPAIQTSDIKSIESGGLEVTALNISQPPVPPLSYGLDRVLFNPGVYQLQDPHSRVYNFDPYLQKITPIVDFDFNKLKEYKTSSQDQALAALAHEHNKKYIGSTSSMTSTLGHFHYLLSNWRPLNLNMLSRAFPEEAANFTLINKAPNAIFLRWKEETGTYAIDADKQYDGANVLMMLGKSMEKLLTLPREEYERYHKDSINTITQAEKEEPESYEYTTMGDFLMRSQLDAYDPRLPGTGMFDLKTRAVVTIRMDAQGYEDMLGYEIHTLQGRFESYEREYYDMMRSTMLKYMLQARMGRMDGIFVAYHNVERIFGFQYLSIMEMDRALHGQVDTCLGDQEFRVSLKLMNEVLEMATKQSPGVSLRMHFEAVETPTTMMWVFAEPMEESEIEKIQASGKAKVEEFERTMMGIDKVEEKPAASEAASEPSATSAEAGTAESSAATTSPTDYTSTAHPADPMFYDKLASDASSTHRPLFAATIIVQNYVNGEPCPENRPANLTRHDKWEVQYILKEAQMDPAEKWARYEDCKTRRRENFDKARSDEEDGEEKKESFFITMLKDMAKRGREFRGKVDAMEKGREKVVLGLPSPEIVKVDGHASAEEGGEDVEGVDGYVKWLYGHMDGKK